MPYIYISKKYKFKERDVRFKSMARFSNIYKW